MTFEEGNVRACCNCGEVAPVSGMDRARTRDTIGNLARSFHGFVNLNSEMSTFIPRSDRITRAGLPEVVSVSGIDRARTRDALSDLVRFSHGFVNLNSRNVNFYS